MTKDRKDEVLQYLNPLVRVIIEEEGFDVRLGREQERLDYRTIFINSVLQSSKQNTDALTLTQKDLAFFLNVTDSQIYGYLERHSRRLLESDEYKEKSDKWLTKICGFDGVEYENDAKQQLKRISINYSARDCKKMIKALQELELIDDSNYGEALSVEEIEIYKNGN